MFRTRRPPPVRPGRRVVPVEGVVVGDHQSGEFAGVRGHGQEPAEADRDLAKSLQMPADLVSRHLVDRDGASVFLSGRRFHIGEPHAVVAMGVRIDRALPPVTVVDS